MPPQTTILIDNNALSHPKLEERVQGKTIYLPDAVMYELFGAGQWERSINPTLSSLSPFADHVIGTVNLAVLLRQELETGEPTRSVVCDPAVNKRLGPLLRGCHAEPDRAIEYFRESQPTAPNERASRMANIDGYRSLSMDIVAWIKSRSDKSELDRLRSKPELVAGFLKEKNFWPTVIETLRQLLAAADFDCPRWDTRKMESVACCWMRSFAADLCLGVRHSVKTSFGSVSDDELHGDQNDREIVIVGSYADEFLTFDKGAAWLDVALRICIQEMF